MKRLTSSSSELPHQTSGSLYFYNSGIRESEADHELEPTVKEGAGSLLVVMTFGVLEESVAAGRRSFVPAVCVGLGSLNH